MIAWRKHSKALTLKDVAKATGFSASTVSAAFSAQPDPRYREETLVRVREAAEKLGFRVNRQARLLRGGKSQTIMLLKNVTLHQTMVEITMEVQATLEHERYQLISSDLVPNMNLSQITNTVADFRIDGIIIGNIPHGTTLEPIYRECRRSGVEIVSIEGYQPQGSPVYSSDYFQGYCRLFRHLLELGCRKIALVVLEYDLENPFQWKTQGALRAFAQEVKARRGVTGEVYASPYIESYRALERIYFDPGYDSMQTLLKRKKRPDAVVFLSDYFAIGALKACAELKVNVPGEIVITGCDYSALGRNVHPSLTTLKPPYQELCRGAVRALINQIEGKKAREELVTFPMELMEGQSTQRL